MASDGIEFFSLSRKVGLKVANAIVAAALFILLIGNHRFLKVCVFVVNLCLEFHAGATCFFVTRSWFHFGPSGIDFHISFSHDHSCWF